MTQPIRPKGKPSAKPTDDPPDKLPDTRVENLSNLQVDAVTSNPWQNLRRFTSARIALGRSGVSQPTQPHLAFQLAHARARDAVHLELDVKAVQKAIQQIWMRVKSAQPKVDSEANQGQSGVDETFEVLTLQSAAADRNTYLQRPDLGRRLSPSSRDALLALLPPSDLPEQRAFDVAFVVADGLSALAIGSHAVPFLELVMPKLDAEGWTIAPLTLITQGRVAVADEIGQLLQARLVVILIGERPGLSSPDSMGIYLTWMPKVGLTDASRNCISNIRPGGLSYEEGARTLYYLMTKARQKQLSGVGLKDDAALSVKDHEIE